MTREEQIREITMLTCPAYCRNKDKKCAGIQDCDMKCLHYQRCEIVYDNANYRKQVKAEWIEAGFDDYYKCSNCGYIHCDKEQIRLNPQHFLYCGHCNADMVGRR